MYIYIYTYISVFLYEIMLIPNTIILLYFLFFRHLPCSLPEIEMGREYRCSQQEITTSFHHVFTYIKRLLPISLYLGWNYVTYRGFGRNRHLIQLALVHPVIK